MDDFTEILQAAEGGDAAAAERLLPLVYDELRQLAAARLAQEQAGQTLQPTALVHEAYLRLTGADGSKPFSGRAHFFAAAAVAIRRILIDQARRKKSLKRGGDRVRLDFHDALPAHLQEPHDDLIALDDVLDRLKQVHPEEAHVVQLLYFAGLTIAETACVLNVSPRTVGRQWAFARAWLRREIDGSQAAPQIS